MKSKAAPFDAASFLRLVTLGSRTATLGTRTSVEACTVTVFATRTLALLRLYVSFGFLLEGLGAQTELTGFLVDLQQFDADMIAFLDSGLFYGLVAFPVDLGDMQQTFLTRHDSTKQPYGIRLFTTESYSSPTSGRATIALIFAIAAAI